MPATQLKSFDSHYLLGETLRPMLTNAMGSSIEVFDTEGPAEAGPPPHTHPWEEIYLVLDGELEVTVNGKASRVNSGEIVHIPAGATHAYRNITQTHFLTILSKGNASKFFKQCSEEVAMNPPDIPGVIACGESHGIAFKG